MFLRKFLRPNFFSVNLFECSTIVSAGVVWADDDVVCVAEYESQFCALMCGPGSAETLFVAQSVDHSVLPFDCIIVRMVCFLTLMKATCSIGFLDCGVSPTGFVLARMFLEIPSDEVNSVCGPRTHGSLVSCPV